MSYRNVKEKDLENPEFVVPPHVYELSLAELKGYSGISIVNVPKIKKLKLLRVETNVGFTFASESRILLL